MYELLCHLRVRLGKQPNIGQVAKNKVLGCTSQAYADDLLRQAKINQSKLEKHNCFKGKLTLVLIMESSSQGCKKDKNIITGGGVFLGVGSLGKQEGCVGYSWLAKATMNSVACVQPPHSPQKKSGKIFLRGVGRLYTGYEQC